MPNSVTHNYEPGGSWTDYWGNIHTTIEMWPVGSGEDHQYCFDKVTKGDGSNPSWQISIDGTESCLQFDSQEDALRFLRAMTSALEGPNGK